MRSYSRMKTRHFPRALAHLLVLLFFVALAIGDPAKKPSGKYLVYVGSYTEAKAAGKGIYAYRYDAATGDLISLGLAAATVNPSFLAVHPNRRFLYAVNETQNYKGPNSGGVSAFAIDAATGKLTFLNEVASRGADPCYIALDQTGKYVLVANYTGGSVAAFPILDDGRLGDASAFVLHSGHGPNPERQKGPHAHSIDLSADNRFAFVDDLGLDELLVYQFDAAKGSLAPSNPPYARLAPGAGPRHVAFSPSGKFAYVVDELDSTVTVFSYAAATGAFKSLQTIKTLPSDFSGHNGDAEIKVSPSGKFLYASNRGHDSLAVFAIDAGNGSLTSVEYVSVQGRTPRNFEIDPTASLLFAADQDSHKIVIFRIDPTTGRLTPTGKALDVPSPVCIKFVAVE
jgi:6-phosphogluconolactonase